MCASIYPRGIICLRAEKVGGSWGLRLGGLVAFGAEGFGAGGGGLGARPNVADVHPVLRPLPSSVLCPSFPSSTGGQGGLPLEATRGPLEAAEASSREQMLAHPQVLVLCDRTPEATLVWGFM